MGDKRRVLLVAYNAAGHDSLALGYIKAYALKDSAVARKTDIEILNFSNEQNDVRQALYYITDFKPHLVGFSCYCWSMGKILELARSLKQIMPEVPLVAGGPEVGPIAEQYLREHLCLDVVVHDEGEAVFADLLKFYLAKRGRLASIAGISFRDGDTIIRNEMRSPIQDLGEIPSPYLTGALIPRDGVTYVQSFRGCPFRCGFCYEAGRHKGLRFFPYERVQAEIELIMDTPEIRTFHFVDSVFNLNATHLGKIADLLESANRYHTRLRTIEVFTETMDEHAVQSLVRAGVQSVETGPQTAIVETQKRIGRYFDPQKFTNGVRLMQEAGISVWCDLIVGLPGDNFFRCATSVAFVMNLEPAHIVMSILHVLPGTPLFNEASRFGLAFDPAPPHYVVANDTFPFEQIYEAVLFSASVSKEYNLALS
ncbi:MAG: B12-binding domain-containing radical SAM protein [Deltaproteobacteria bacterium]|nr:B12-binding domain-containing radical SAM protein [Deltaproteobacteria bacterium]